MFLRYHRIYMALTDKIEYFVKKPERGMHSEMHALAKEISEFCGEPKKFGMYLGVIKNMGLSRTYQIFAEMKQAKNIKTPGKLFLYLSASRKPNNKLELNKKPLRQSGAKKTNKKYVPNLKKKVSSRKKRNGDYTIG